TSLCPRSLHDALPLSGVLAAGCSTRPRGPGLAGYRRVARLISRLPDGGRRLNDTLARLTLPAAALEDLQSGGMELGVMDAALARSEEHTSELQRGHLV